MSQFLRRLTMTRLTFGSGGSFEAYWKRSDGAGEAGKLATSNTEKIPTSSSPDGKVLAYSGIGGATSADIMILRIGKNNQREVFLQTPFMEEGAQFSPNGRWIA